MNTTVFGLQLFPFDVRDEGLERVLDLSLNAVRANTLLAAVSYIDEQQPQPSGLLPHNTVHSTYATRSGFYFEPDWDTYPPGLRPARSAEEAGEHELHALKEACTELGVAFVPWLQLLGGGFSWANDTPWVVNASGEPVPGWLCPRKQVVRKFVTAVVHDVIRRFHSRVLFVDRIRYPEWGPHGLIDACTCFCGECQQAAEAEGLDIGALRARLNEVIGSLEGRVERLRPGLPDSLATALPLLAGRREWLHWLQFRAEGLTGCVEAAAHAAEPNAKLWLDLWPPTYGGLLGQDLGALAQQSAMVKSFAYHRLAGGANIAGYIRALAHSREARQFLYREYLQVFGLDGPHHFEQFEADGLALSFVTDETCRTVRGSAPVPACAGVQVFQVGSRGVFQALEAARAAGPAGYMLYAYGWASEDELRTAGEWWESLERAGEAS